MPSLLRQLVDLGRVVVDAARSGAPPAPAADRAAGAGRAGRAGRTGRAEGPRPAAPRTAAAQYAPVADGDADPGEVVWTWVPFEEDASQGKDRPVLVVSRTGDRLVALMLTSKDHDRDAAEQARRGRSWMDVGTGSWDRERRPSEVRLDRVLHLDAAAVRREGAALDRAVFDAVVAAASRLHGWD